MTSHPLLLLTNRVAACCRRSANESVRAGPRLATRRRKRRRRRSVEDCSSSTNSPKAPRIHAESNTEGCVWLSGWGGQGLFVFVAKTGTEREHACSSVRDCICCLSDTQTPPPSRSLSVSAEIIPLLVKWKAVAVGCFCVIVIHFRKWIAACPPAVCAWAELLIYRPYFFFYQNWAVRYCWQMLPSDGEIMRASLEG